MNRLGSVVVGVDFSTCGGSALAQAVRLAAFGEATIFPVHVLDAMMFSDAALGVTPFLPDMTGTMIADAKRNWPEVRAAAGAPPSLELEVVVGRPATEIIALARKQKAGLVVVGACGESSHTTIGTTAAACVRHAPCPTLVVEEGKGGGFRRICVGVDFSLQSREALDMAMRVAAMDGSEVHAVHVFRAPWVGRRAKGSPLAQNTAAQAQYRELLRDKLAAFCARRPELVWTNARTEVVEDASYGGGLARYVREAKADLLVIGTRGHTNLRDVLLGSTAERVVGLSPCSVLTVPPKP